MQEKRNNMNFNQIGENFVNLLPENDTDTDI